MRFVGVECFADQYFFGRLLNNYNYIRKERNDTEVIKSVTERSKGNFCIGIIDIDKNKKIPADFEKLVENENTQIYKHKDNCQFLFLVGPRQFEHWIRVYLQTEGKTANDFGYENFNEFMEESKSTSPHKNERFRSIMNFVFENYENSSNHITQVSAHLSYLIEKKYEFDKDEFLNI